MNFRDFIGGHPLGVLLRLAVISLLVGIVLSLLGVTPRNFLRVLDDFARHVYDLGFGAIQWLIEYLFLGAILVVPVWLVMRLLRARPKNDA
jgi:Na+/H+-dicarboxylate symporter